jgi:hypothetical protein
MMAKHESRASRTIGHPAARLLLSSTASLGAIAAVGCIEIERGHCAKRGGDLACDGQKCVMSLEEELETANGCADEVPARGGFVHVEYGLPDDFGTFERDLKEAIERRTPLLECNEEEIIELHPRFEVLHAEVIEPLDGWSRVRRGSIDLGKIEEFNAAVNAWVDASCKEPLDGDDPEPGMDTAMPPDDSGNPPDDPSMCDCPETTPFCDEETLECMACDEMPDPDGACRDRDSSTPLCVGGSCVACTAELCDEDGRQVCDAQTNACVPCTEHAQCEVGACELATGQCFPKDAAVFVVDKEGGAGVDEISVAGVIASLDEEVVYAVIRVRAAFDAMGNEDPYGVVVIGEGKIIALLADSEELPRITGAGDGEVLRVEGQGTAVYVDELRLAGHQGGVGLRVGLGASAWLDRTRVVLNAGGGIVAEEGSTLMLRNTMVGSNGSGGLGQHGLDVLGATVQVRFSTLAKNDASEADSIHCEGGEVQVRSSIVVGSDGNSIDCAGIDIHHSALDEDIEGDGNENVGPWTFEWFVVEPGNFHLSPAGGLEFMGIALWEDGDPLFDIDGDPRPTDTPDYAGADRIL